MFCRFGFDDDSRPVAATAWLNDVWIRPSRAIATAVSTEQLRAQIERGLHADAIQHQASPARTRDLLDPLGGFGGITVVHDVVGAERLGVP